MNKAEQLAKLKEERDRIKGVLNKVAVADPQIEGNYKAKFEDFGDDLESQVAERAEHEVALSVEQNLEVRLGQVEEEIKTLESA